MSEDLNAELLHDFGDPEPMTCTGCDKEVPRDADECPGCGHVGFYYDPHPQFEWTSQLVRQIVAATAGYAALRIDLPADGQAVMWWDGGFEGRARGPGGSWDSFSLGVEEVVAYANLVELVHWKELPPSIRRQMNPEAEGRPA